MKRIALIGGLLLLGCGSSANVVMPLDTYASLHDLPNDGWKNFRVDSQLVLFAPPKSCDVKIADTPAELQSGGESLAGHPLARTPTAVRVTKGLAYTGAGWIALQVQAPDQTKWLRLDGGRSAGCVYTDVPDLQSANEPVGKPHYLATWKPACTEIHAVGQAPDSLLLEGGRATSIRVEAFELGPGTAAEHVAGKTGTTIWYVADGGSLRLRRDTLETCFSPTPTDDSVDLYALLRIHPDRCTETTEAGKRHVACSTTLGIWSGRVENNAIELRMGRQTLGPVHFVDGWPVDGTAFASTVVAFTQGSGESPGENLLYRVLAMSVDKARAAGNTSVRFATPDDPAVNYRVHLDVSNVVILPLEQRVVPRVTQYVKETIKVNNPEYPEAKRRIVRAEQRLREAEAEYDRQYQAYQNAQQAAYNECKNQAANVEDDRLRVLANTTCDIANMAIDLKPSSSEKDTARNERDAARTKLSNTPERIDKKIMADWNYEEVQFSRSSRAVLRVRFERVDTKKPRVLEFPLQYNWSDREVKGDARHNVEGHQPDRSKMQGNDGMLAPLASQALIKVQEQIRAAISRAMIEEAKLSFAARGGNSALGFEAVHAIAFEVAGPRIERAERRGRASLGSDPYALPSQSIILQEGQCLLAVSAFDGDSIGLSMGTSDGRFADQRGGGSSYLELCRSDLGQADHVEALQIASSAPGQARWVLFRTREVGTGSSATGRRKR